MIHTILVDILLASASFLALACILGLIAMRDVYQKLQYLTPIASLCAPLIVMAVWVQTHSFQARIKALLIFAILFLTNAVISHATARAQRIRSKGHWEPRHADDDVERIA